MMSLLFDGEDKPLTYGQALVALAQQVSWPTEKHRAEVVRAIQTEHDLVPAEPDRKTLYNDPRDLTLADQDAKIAQLEKQLRVAQLEAEVATATAANRDGVSGGSQVAGTPLPPPPPVADPFPRSGAAPVSAEG